MDNLFRSDDSEDEDEVYEEAVQQNSKLSPEELALALEEIGDVPEDPEYENAAPSNDRDVMAFGAVKVQQKKLSALVAEAIKPHKLAINASMQVVEKAFRLMGVTAVELPDTKFLRLQQTDRLSSTKMKAFYADTIISELLTNITGLDFEARADEQEYEALRAGKLDPPSVDSCKTIDWETAMDCAHRKKMAAARAAQKKRKAMEEAAEAHANEDVAQKPKPFERTVRRRV